MVVPIGTLVVFFTVMSLSGALDVARSEGFGFGPKKNLASIMMLHWMKSGNVLVIHMTAVILCYIQGSRKRKDSIRETWMPRGDELEKLEKEKGIVVRFVIGHR